jgi:hypothetical protein
MNRLRSLTNLWHQGKISGLEYSKRAAKLMHASPPKKRKASAGKESEAEEKDGRS